MKRNYFGIIIAVILFVLLIAMVLGFLMWLIYTVGPLQVGASFLLVVVIVFIYVVCETLWQNRRMNKKQ